MPLIPNDDTAALLTRPCARPATGAAGQGRDSVNNDTAPADQSTCGVGTSTCNVLGNTPCCIANTIFITPATPAAADVWPMLDLIDPNHSGSFPGSVRPCP
ncbi:hypothetical protein LAUMK13_05545 [Mycobacterium innocens]|uniref:Uncharacterized protein n=1 Tax=Mycobacterium innocens TaxID=2341083 RepID=A0A498QNP2_9MYCO|nr:hypothetical protein LAUMK13_05545 [Mycobacterium innocens]